MGHTVTHSSSPTWGCSNDQKRQNVFVPVSSHCLHPPGFVNIKYDIYIYIYIYIYI